MGIKKINGVEGFINKFVRARGGDSTGLDAVSAAPPGSPGDASGSPLGHTATGGVVSDWVDPSPGNVYRTHIFTSTGTFDVSALSGTYPANVEYLVVAGGGSGGSHSTSGGGGAGGLRTNLTGHPAATPVAFPVSVSPYAVTVGAGGAGAGYSPLTGHVGSDSSLGPITANGGGTGAFDQAAGGPGGSGGGAGGSSGSSYAGGATVAVTTPSPWPGPSTQGYAGGDNKPARDSPYTSGGGGGAGGVGGTGGSNAGAGGAGLQVLIAGNAASTGVGALNPGPGEYQWFAGGGGGASSHYGGNDGAGGVGGGGGGGAGPGGTPGQANTGGGGGGKTEPHGSPYVPSGRGGSGIVAVRYQIGTTAPNAKATGGAISLYNGKWIHTFVNSGTFATGPTWSSATVEYVVVAGGGGSNNEDLGGAGGAGGFITGTTPIGAHPVSTAIQVGAGGNLSVSDYYHGKSGTPSYFGTPLTAYGGGGGAGKQPGATAEAQPGGSGGGGDHAPNPGADGNKQTGTSSAAPITPQGYPGGNGASPHGTGGGGGAGGAGGNASNPPAQGGVGGLGRQIPSTFRNPDSATSLGATGPTGSVPATNPGGDTSGKFWFAGGGGGGVDSGSSGGGGGGAGVGASYAGGGYGGHRPDRMGTSGTQSTGGGGGATDNGHQSPALCQGNGGSGIVLIAYPS